METILAETSDMTQMVDSAMGIANMVGGILLAIAVFFLFLRLISGFINRLRTRRSMKKIKKSLTPKQESHDRIPNSYSYSAKGLAGEARERQRVREERRAQWEREYKKNTRKR